MTNVDDARLLAESHELSGKLFQVVEQAQADFSAIAETFELTALQARTVLWLEHPSSMRDLAEHLACDASNVTGLADRLEKRGVVERAADSGDRRVKHLRLTKEGATLRTRLARQVAKRSTVTAQLEPDDRQQLSHLLDKLLS